MPSDPARPRREDDDFELRDDEGRLPTEDLVEDPDVDFDEEGLRAEDLDLELAPADFDLDVADDPLRDDLDLDDVEPVLVLFFEEVDLLAELLPDFDEADFDPANFELLDLELDGFDELDFELEDFELVDLELDDLDEPDFEPEGLDLEPDELDFEPEDFFAVGIYFFPPVARFYLKYLTRSNLQTTYHFKNADFVIWETKCRFKSARLSANQILPCGSLPTLRKRCAC